MKKILLIGDSIRIGYDRYVKERMALLSEVYYPSENCRFSEYILRNLHNWTDNLQLYDADAVHFNAGHWDTVRIYGDEPLTRLENYTDNLCRIVKRIRFLFPHAKIIFATSTPVQEDGYIADFECRTNADVRTYNAAAVKALAQEGVIINDLYALLENAPASYHSDQTHFYTPDATALLGMRVSDVLCDALALDKSKLILPDKTKFVRPDAKGDRELFEKYRHIYRLKVQTPKDREL